LSASGGADDATACSMRSRAFPMRCRFCRRRCGSCPSATQCSGSGHGAGVSSELGREALGLCRSVPAGCRWSARSAPYGRRGGAGRGRARGPCRESLLHVGRRRILGEPRHGRGLAAGSGSCGLVSAGDEAENQGGRYAVRLAVPSLPRYYLRCRCW
jgi:hypothetical protein